MKKYAIIVAVVLTLVTTLACAAGTPAPPGSVTAVPPVTKETGATGKTEWDKVVEAARKENQVVIFTNIGGQNRAELTAAFAAKYGVKLEFLVVSRGLELTQRLVTERRAGLFTADVIVTGATTIITTMKPEGFLDAIEPLLILPEVRDPKVWRGGSPFLDKERKTSPLIAYYNRYLARNTELVKEGDVKSYRDLLDPRWKGKIIMNDPTISGSANSFIGLVTKAWGPESTRDFLRQLVKQEPSITRDRRVQVEALARGKFPLSLASSAEPIAEFMSIGAPIAYVKVKEGGSVTASSGVVAIPSQRPHPNATIVFLNWLLGKEGIAVFATAFGQPGSRLDLPYKTAPGYFPPEPGEAVIVEDEEDILMKVNQMDVAKEIFAPLLK